MSTVYPNESKVTLKIDSFINGINTTKDSSLLNINYALDVQNFNYQDGALKNGLGFADLIKEITTDDEYEEISQDLETIGSVEKVFHFYIFNQETQTRDDKLIFVNYENKLYHIGLYDQTKKLSLLRGVTFTKTPNAVRYRLNGEDVMIFTSESDNMVVWNGYSEPYDVLDTPKISSMAVHYERLFATVDGEKNSVWFSDDLDPTNWSVSLDEAGFIEMVDERGALLKVVSFCDYVYIFREHGITRLSAYGEQQNFSVSNLFVSSGKIYAESVCVCGDEIIFLASDGLYKFDGLNAVKILENISENISNIASQKTSACYYNGSYYLACKYNFLSDSDSCEDKFYSNALLEIDINTHKLKNITHGVNIKYITAVNSDKFSGVITLSSKSELTGFVPTVISNSGTYFVMPLTKVWLSPITGVNDVYKQKTLKKINIQTKGDIILSIYHDGEETNFYFSGSNTGLITKLTNVSLNTFQFKIQSVTTVCDIKNLQFEFFVTDGRK